MTARGRAEGLTARGRAEGLTARGRAVPSATALLFTVFVIGTCGLTYELLAGTVASYVLGDSVMQFSTVIGVYLFAMGVGAWASSFIHKDISVRFVEIELVVALIGGASGAILFLAFARVAWFQVILYGLVFLVGVLVGLEIPLLMRILKDRYELKELVSRVLTADYLGALLASLAFPIFLVPKLGLIRGGFAVGLMNAAVGLWCTYLLRDAFRRPRMALFLQVQGGLVSILLLAGFVWSENLTKLAEDQLYSDPIIHAERTPYQRIILTRGRSGFHLYLNGHLQFTSYDEHRYHEMLVHPAFALRANWSAPVHKVLILGGGDGLAVREVLRYPEIEHVQLVDLDPGVTDLARNNALLSALNQGALLDTRVKVTNADAMVWLHRRWLASKKSPQMRYDLMIVDFPDPNTYALGKLYTTRFYRLAQTALADEGVLVVQSTSPLYARQSYWCVQDTLEAAGWSTQPYHVAVPSFGEWGFFLAAKHPFDAPQRLPKLNKDVELRYLTHESLRAAFVFPIDMSKVHVGPNRLDNQILVQTYIQEWAKWR